MSTLKLPAPIRLLRPHQWIKNLLVLAAPGAAGRFFELAVLVETALIFFAFSLMSSAGYVLNDYRDVHADRLHPKKRLRPLASGEVSLATARLLFPLLLVLSLVIAARTGLAAMWVVAAYGVVTMSYSLFFKQVPWLELFVVSAGFVLRAVAGGQATSIPLSAAFLVVVSAGSLLMICSKRIGEAKASGRSRKSRPVLERYDIRHLEVFAVSMVVLSVAAYAAWATDLIVVPGVTERVEGQAALLLVSVLPFSAAVGRFAYLGVFGHCETPEHVVVKDSFMRVSSVLWLICYGIGVYL